jgi:hypothetical protein
LFGRKETKVLLLSLFARDPDHLKLRLRFPQLVILAVSLSLSGLEALNITMTGYATYRICLHQRLSSGEDPIFVT